MPGTILGVWHTAVNKKKRSLSSHNLYCSRMYTIVPCFKLVLDLLTQSHKGVRVWKVFLYSFHISLPNYQQAGVLPYRPTLLPYLAIPFTASKEKASSPLVFPFLFFTLHDTCMLSPGSYLFSPLAQAVSSILL